MSVFLLNSLYIADQAIWAVHTSVRSITMATHISRSGGDSRDEQSRHLKVRGTIKSKIYC